jgi:hypothetical protein
MFKATEKNLMVNAVEGGRLISATGLQVAANQWPQINIIGDFQ